MSAVLPDWSVIRRVGGLAVVERSGTTDCRPTPLRLFERSEFERLENCRACVAAAAFLAEYLFGLWLNKTFPECFDGLVAVTS